MKRKRIALTLGLMFLLIAVLAAGMSVPIIWPDIANYRTNDSKSPTAPPAIVQTMSVYGD